MKYQYLSLAALALLGKVSAAEVERTLSPMDPAYYSNVDISEQSEQQQQPHSFYRNNINYGQRMYQVQRSHAHQVRDAFDQDENSVSQYDDGHNHKHMDFDLFEGVQHQSRSVHPHHHRHHQSHAQIPTHYLNRNGRQSFVQRQISHNSAQSQQIRSRDNYDFDQNSVSQYDDMPYYPYEKYKSKKDLKDEIALQNEMNEETYESQTINNMLQTQSDKWQKQKSEKRYRNGAKNRDAYDLDDNTGSEYDDAQNINGGNPYFKHLSNDVPVAGDLRVMKKQILRDLERKEAEEDRKKSGVMGPAPFSPEGLKQQAEAKKGAAEGFSGAVPKSSEAAKDTAEVVSDDANPELQKDGKEKEEKPASLTQVTRAVRDMNTQNQTALTSNQQNKNKNITATASVNQTKQVNQTARANQSAKANESVQVNQTKLVNSSIQANKSVSANMTIQSNKTQAVTVNANKTVAANVTKN